MTRTSAGRFTAGQGRSGRQELLWEKAPLTDGMYSDLLELSLTSVDCLSIAEVIMSDVRKAA